MRRTYRQIRFFIMLLAFSYLVGCSMLFAPHRDSTEYQKLIEVAVESSHGTCQAAELEHLKGLTQYLNYYTTYIPDNELMHSGVIELDQSVQRLYDSTQPNSLELPITPKFCQLRLRIINQMALNLAKASGGKLE